MIVSTHSRPKAAAVQYCNGKGFSIVSTHSRPKAAADADTVEETDKANVSTHSRPKAAAVDGERWSFLNWFQHTAARRRLPDVDKFKFNSTVVSTHSRPKAAA